MTKNSQIPLISSRYCWLSAKPKYCLRSYLLYWRTTCQLISTSLIKSKPKFHSLWKSTKKNVNDFDMQMECISVRNFIIHIRYSWFLHFEFNAYHIQLSEINTLIQFAELRKSHTFSHSQVWTKNVSGCLVFSNCCDDKMFHWWSFFLCLVASVLFAYKGNILLNVAFAGKNIQW